MIKRFFDLTISLIALLLMSPLLAVIALQVRRKMGTPVLFRQPRPGLHGQPFQLLKFRTMRDARDAGGTPLPDSERLNAFGRWLRATSLDELPELWNVLRGEMSLVGPRPTSFDAGTYQLWQTERLDVPVGVTGLWQVLARGSSEFDERCRLDIDYIRKDDDVNTHSERAHARGHKRRERLEPLGRCAVLVELALLDLGSFADSALRLGSADDDEVPGLQVGAARRGAGGPERGLDQVARHGPVRVVAYGAAAADVRVEVA